MKFKTKIILISNLYKFFEKKLFKRLLPPGFCLDKFLDKFLDENCPQITTKLQTFAKEGKIAITATNGKKTVTNIFLEILKQADKSYITNVVNIENQTLRKPVYLSIINNLQRCYKIFKREIKKDFYVMALDENELSTYFNSMKFDYLLLNNLFIDQKDDLTLVDKRKKIIEALKLNSDIKLIINADEPYFYKIDEIEKEKNIKKIYYGFNKIEFLGDDVSQKNDLMICPKCNCALEYEKRFYSHIGKYNCDCAFKRPKLDISANADIFNDYCFLDVTYKNENYIFKFPFGGMYSAYNALSLIALSFCLGIERTSVSKAFENYKGTKGVEEKIKDKISLITIKNPTSLSEALSRLKKNKNTKIVFALSDEKEDGTDTSWIFDSNFDVLKNFENKIYVTAKRFDDMALRLKYAGVNPSLIVMEQDIKTALKCCYYDLKEKENMLILLSPSIVKEIVNIDY